MTSDERTWRKLIDAWHMIGERDAEIARLRGRLAAAEEAVRELQAMNERAREDAA